MKQKLFLVMFLAAALLATTSKVNAAGGYEKEKIAATSSDETFTIKPGFLLQTGWSYLDNKDVDGSVKNEGVYLYSRFWFKGGLGEDLTYNLTFQTVEVEDTDKALSALVYEAYWNYKFMDVWQLKVGYQKLSFGYDYDIGIGYLAFPAGALITKEITPGVQGGVTLHGTALDKKLYYRVGIYGGKMGTHTENSVKVPNWNDNRADVLLGADYVVLGEKYDGFADFNGNQALMVGLGSWVDSSWINDVGPKHGMSYAGIFAKYKVSNFGVGLDYYMAQQDAVDQGFVANLSYVFLAKHEVALRYNSYIDDKDDSDSSASKIELAYNRYISGNNAKLSACYSTSNRGENAPITIFKGDELTLRASFMY